MGEGLNKERTDTKTCKNFMRLEKEWLNTKADFFHGEKIGNEEAASLHSLLICKKGGIIMPVTSGQGQYMEKAPLEWLARLFRLLGWAKGHMPDYAIFGADPVNLCTGNFIYQKEDISVPGRVSLSFSRFYNSIGVMEENKENYALGSNWRHNYECRIETGENGEKTVFLGDGRQIVYKKDIKNEYQPVYGGKEKLTSKRDGYEFTGKDAAVSYFCQSGRLLWQKDNNENTIAFKYNDANQLILAETSTGSSLSFRYNADGRLIGASDHTGRNVLYKYQYGVLAEAVNPEGHAHQYGYDEAGNLKRITTPRGICGLHNTYDGIGRAVKQEMPDGKTIRMRYDGEDNRSYALERDGALAAYEYDDRMRHVKTTDAAGEEGYSYNDRNQKTMWKDKKGNKTFFSYDQNGNMAKIATAENEEYTFQYNGQNQLIEATGPGKEKSRCEYDKKGNLSKITNSLGQATHISRQENGLVHMVEWPDRSKEILHYDKRLNVIKWEEGTGGVHLFEYDELNRITGYKDANGNGMAYAYDSLHHMIENTSQSGDSRKYEYNPSGMLAKFTDYDGTAMEWKYDACNRIEEIKNKEGNVVKYKYDAMGRVNQIIYPNGGREAL